MDDVLFVWTAAYQTCLMRTCVPRLLSGLYQLFDLCLIKLVLTVWPLISTLAGLVTKQCLMVFDGVWSPNIYRLSRPLGIKTKQQNSAKQIHPSPLLISLLTAFTASCSQRLKRSSYSLSKINFRSLDLTCWHESTKPLRLRYLYASNTNF